MEDKPLFQVKSELDPFDAYGDDSVIVDEDNDNASIVIQSTRAKLAALRAKDKVNDDIFKEADRDLEQILELEVLNKSPIPVKEPTVIITPKLTNVGGGANKEKLFQSIKETFSEIFQLMIVMLESKALFPQLPNEAEKVSKRSREFETRFNRSVFETKQQVRLYVLVHSPKCKLAQCGNSIIFLLSALSIACSAQCGKNRNSLSLKFFREINTLVTSLVKVLLSRNF